MKSCRPAQRQRLIFAYTIVCILTVALLCRLAYLMLGKADYYGAKAKDVQQRERSIKAERGIIYDRNGVVLAGNKPVSTISVIHNQITEPERVISVLSEVLGIDEAKKKHLIKSVTWVLTG